MGADIGEIGPGFSATIQNFLIWLIYQALRPIHGKGLGRIIDWTGRVFPRANYSIVHVFDRGLLKIPLWDGYWLAPLLRQETYEPEVRLFLEGRLGLGATFIDCGANVGYWSVFAAEKVGPEGMVIAIEPSARLHSLLGENAELNHAPILPLKAAVWHRSGELLELATDDARHSWSSVQDAIKDDLRSSGFRLEEVPSLALDDLRERIPSGSDVVIKLDVEGVEWDAIQGARRLIDDGAVVVFEDHDRDDVSLPQRLMEAMRLHIFAFEGGRLELLPDAQAIKRQRASKSHRYVASRSPSPPI